MSDLFTRPKYFRDVVFHRHTDRQIGWLELFYDLVYVATLIQIGNFLSDNVSVLGFGQFFVLMTLVWWAWSGETFYQNLFFVDDIWHRILVFTQMFGVAVIGLSVSEAFGDLYVQFTLAYILVRIMLILMWVRVYNNHPESRSLSLGYISGFGIGAVIWFGSLFLPADIHWVGWLVAIAFEFIVPTIPAMRRKQAAWEIDKHHITERFGIFTIIVLGEAFVKILDDAQGTQILVEQMLFSTAGLTVLYSLWWLYFSDTAGKAVDFVSTFKPVAWLYGHVPLSASLVAFAVGAKKLFAETISYPGEDVTPKYRILYAVSVALYLVSLALIDYGMDDEQTSASQNTEALVHIIGAVIVLIIGFFVTGVTATQFVAMIAVVMILQVGYSVYQSMTGEDKAHLAHKNLETS